MIEPLSAMEIAAAALVVLFSCIVFSAMGFGIGIVGIPLLLFLLDPADAVVVLNMCAFPVVILIVLRNRAHLPIRRVAPVGAAGMLGAIIGAFALRSAGVALPKEVLGIAVLAVIIAVSAPDAMKLTRDAVNIPSLRRFRRPSNANANSDRNAPQPQAAANPPSGNSNAPQPQSHADPDSATPATRSGDANANASQPQAAAPAAQPSATRRALTRLALNRHPRIVGPVSGFLAGLFVTALGVGAPLVVMFFISQGLQRQAVRVSMSALFLFIGTAMMMSYAANGLIRQDQLPLIAACLAASVIGALIGDRIAGRLTDAVWRSAVIAIVLITSAAALARELAALLSA